MDVGYKIRKLRESRGMEQLELANRINISQSKMNKIETGFQKRLEPEILRDIAKVLGVSIDELLNNGNESNLQEDDFEEFISDPDLKRWHKELPKSPEEDLRKLRKMWEIIKSEKD